MFPIFIPEQNLFFRMNAIIGFTALAAAHVNQPDQVQEYLNKISTSGQHLFPPEPDSAESAVQCVEVYACRVLRQEET